LLTPIQCGMARSALKWTQKDLSKKANVSAATINSFEQGRKIHPRTMNALQEAFLLTMFIEFSGDNGVNYHGPKREYLY